MNPAHILHIVPQSTWATAQHNEQYTGDTLATEGFIHCSRPEQIIAIANECFPRRHDLLLLVIEVSRVQAAIRYEDLYASGKEYPHIYGPLNREAVINVVALLPDADGTFSKLPKIQ